MDSNLSSPFREIVDSLESEIGLIIRSSRRIERLDESMYKIEGYLKSMKELNRIRCYTDDERFDNLFKLLEDYKSLNKTVNKILVPLNQKKKREIAGKLHTGVQPLITLASSAIKELEENIRLVEAQEKIKNYEYEMRKKDEEILKLKEQNKSLFELASTLFMENSVERREQSRTESKQRRVFGDINLKESIKRYLIELYDCFTYDQPFEMYQRVLNKMNNLVKHSEFHDLKKWTEFVLKYLDIFRDDPEGLKKVSKEYIQQVRLKLGWYEDEMDLKRMLYEDVSHT